MAPEDHLIEIRNLSVEFHTSHGVVKAVQNVSFHVDAGETVAVLGESGSGKSVSASAILDLIDMPPGLITSGEILYRGQDLLYADRATRRKIAGRKIAMIFQDPLAALNPVYSVGWQIMEAFRVHDVSIGDMRAAVIRLLARVGIPEPEKRIDHYPHQFSGGQRQRVMIAMAIALKPDLLIADEPTTALDVTIQAEILRLLRDLQQETGMGLLLITHDLGVVAEVADRVVVMQNGAIVETGDLATVFDTPKDPYTRRLLDSIPGRKGFAANPAPERGLAEPLLKVDKLVKDFAGFRALHGVSLEMWKGETLGIVGESGSGKSTLARAILDLDRPTSGTVRYRGEAVDKMTRKQSFALRRKIQVVFQDPTASLNPFMSIAQIISEPWAIHPDVLPKGQWKARVAELLEQVGMKPEHADRHPHQFSGGQRQRIAIARAIALKPELIVCDEALSALDVSIQAQVIQLLKDLRAQFGLSYLFIAHDLSVVRDFCDRVIVMRHGRIVEEGPTPRVFEHPEADYTRELLAASPLAAGRSRLAATSG